MNIRSDHPLICISQQINSLCSPLQSLGIHHFSYLKKFNDGKRLNLSNNPQWIFDYYNLELYKSSVFEPLPLNDQSKLDIWIGDYDLDVFRHGKLYYNFSHTITITESNANFRETFLFSTKPDKYHVISDLVNHKDLLYHFIAYLKNQTIELLKDADKYSLRIDSKTMSQNIYQNTYLNNQLITDYYQATQINKYFFDLQNGQRVYLTDREIDCLCHLLENRSASVTATLMNISRRTVESYLDNIRLKLNCNSKAELYQFVINNKYLQALRLI